MARLIYEDPQLPFSAYNSDGVRMLSMALSEALASVRQAAARPLSEADAFRISKALASTLMRVHDSGERNPEALKRAALNGVFAPPTTH